jgi:uncharacterized protein (TIGR02231 family)
VKKHRDDASPRSGKEEKAARQVQSKTIDINGSVRSVTLLEDRAQVWRSGALIVPAGSCTLRFGGVAPVLSDRSVSAVAHGAGNVRVTDIRVCREQRPARESLGQNDSAAFRLERAEDEKELLLHRLRGASQQTERIDKVARKALKDIATDVAWGAIEPMLWGKDLGDVNESERRIRDVYLELKAQLEDLEEEIADLRARKEAEERPDLEVVASIEVDIEVAKRSELNLKLGYLVPSACWRPCHRATLRSLDGEKRLEMETDAMVWQNTGEDWTDVELSYSTQRSSLGNEPPLLFDDVLSAREKPEQIVVTEREHEIQTTGLGARSKMSDGLPGVDDGGKTVAIKSKTSMSIPSDGRPYRVPLARFETVAEDELVLMPEINTAVVRRVSLINDGEIPLLAGPVELVSDSGLIGKSSILFVAPGAEFAIGFGPAASIRVSRKMDRVENEPGHLSRSVKTENSITLHLSNIGVDEQSFSVTERIPVSEIEEVEVKLDKKATSSGGVADDDGFVTWKVNLEGGDTQTLELRYTVARKRRVEVE